MGALLLLGLVLGLAFLVTAYVTASPRDQRPACHDCSVYLGRWWEPGLVVFVIGIGLTAWVLGVVVGSAIQALLRRRAARQHDTYEGDDPTNRRLR